ncbi:MAG: TIGR01777 family oxidoreductase [Gemmatimonadota bacterium]
MPDKIYHTVLPVPPEKAFDWHERPGAFERLTPPWEDVEVVSRSGGIRDGGEVRLKISKGPMALDWHLRHTDYRAGEQFVDQQVSGPFEHYRHEHRFLAGPEPGTTRLEDALSWDVPLGAAGEWVGGARVERELDRTFRFRHTRVRQDLELHERYREVPRKRVAISGASGLIGSTLGHLLTTGGHEVVPLVRSRAEADAGGGIYWSVRDEVVDEEGLQGVDALVHLAGEPINAVRWTEEKKRAIRESRVQGTRLLSQTLAQLPGGPEAMICASAVGYYGDRGDQVVTEETDRGKGFLAETVDAWEGASRRAEGAGIRVVRVRFGLVLSPDGGALPKMLWAFKSGLAGRIGNGRQYVPWIDLDDVTGILYHAIMDPGVRGVLNGTAPNPVTNATFTDILGRVLHRPTVVPVPALAVRAALGEMGEELLLKGQRARPKRTEASGYQFRFRDLEPSLRHQLGRHDDDGPRESG